MHMQWPHVNAATVQSVAHRYMSIARQRLGTLTDNDLRHPLTIPSMGCRCVLRRGLCDDLTMAAAMTCHLSPPPQRGDERAVNRRW